MTQFKGTGVFATAEQCQKILTQITIYNNTPDLAFSSAHAIHGGLKECAKEMVHSLIDEMAIYNGLPEWEGHYGFNPETLEFNKPIT